MYKIAYCCSGLSIYVETDSSKHAVWSHCTSHALHAMCTYQPRPVLHCYAQQTSLCTPLSGTENLAPLSDTANLTPQGPQSGTTNLRLYHHTRFGGNFSPLCGTRNTRCICEIYKNLAIANRSRVSCTQYVDGNYDNPVTLKSRLRVTQGHWNWCHSKAWVRFLIRLL